MTSLHLPMEKPSISSSSSITGEEMARLLRSNDPVSNLLYLSRGSSTGERAADMSEEKIVNLFKSNSGLFKSSDSIQKVFSLLQSSGVQLPESSLCSSDTKPQPAESCRSRGLMFPSADSKSPLSRSRTSVLLRSTSEGGAATKTADSMLKGEMPFLTSSDWCINEQSIDTKMAFSPEAMMKVAPGASNNAKKTTGPARIDWDSFYRQHLPPAGKVIKPDPVAATKVLPEVPTSGPTSLPPVKEKPQQQKKSPPAKRKRVRKRRPRPSMEPEVKEYVERADGDVLLGRGGRGNNWPGNKRYHDAKVAIQPRYRQATKEDKTGISQELVDGVGDWGGRFLKEDDKGWYVVTNMMARKKASQALREDNTAEARKAKRTKYGK